MRFSTSSVVCAVALSASVANASIVNAAPINIEARGANGGMNTAVIGNAGNLASGVSGLINADGEIANGDNDMWTKLSGRDLSWVDAEIISARDFETREAKGGKNTAAIGKAGEFSSEVSGLVNTASEIVSGAKSFWDSIVNRRDESSAIDADFLSGLESREPKQHHGKGHKSDNKEHKGSKQARDAVDSLIAELDTRSPKGFTAAIGKAGNIANYANEAINVGTEVVDGAKSFWDQLTSRSASDEFISALATRSTAEDNFIDTLLNARGTTAEDSFIDSLISAREAEAKVHHQEHKSNKDHKD
ncbi:hypothetical protein BJ878DRAFT_483644 [Calycina marina]|uniref:Uncharacterized protein n=1 Tax=Calycina marina TaxID=1763456 RepID=A0A9P8CCW0_9HELO|nr:hypothetical protein BJ878DRAFT_483644 [Calycina marina]